MQSFPMNKRTMFQFPAASPFLFSIALLILSMTSPTLFGQTVERTIILRDGSHLVVNLDDKTLPVKRVDEYGDVKDVHLKWSGIEKLALSKSKATDELFRTRRLLGQLGAPSYADREAAQDELIKRGNRFRTIIDNFVATDPEVKWRLSVVREKIEKDYSRKTMQDDRTGSLDWWLLDDEPEQRIFGDVGDLKIETELNEVPITLLRKQIAMVTNEKIDVAVKASGGSGLEQVFDNPQEPDKLVLPGYVWIDFENTSEGEEVLTKNVLNDEFLADGIWMTSTDPNGLVIAQSYGCGGLSGKPCACGPGYRRRG